MRVVSTLVALGLTIPAAGICTNSECGMLGGAADPAYRVSPYLHAYYTANGRGLASIDCCAYDSRTDAGPLTVRTPRNLSLAGACCVSGDVVTFMPGIRSKTLHLLVGVDVYFR